jgi:hypothetical protein
LRNDVQLPVASDRGSLRSLRRLNHPFGPPHPLEKFVVFLVKDKGAPILVPEKHEEDQQ